MLNEFLQRGEANSAGDEEAAIIQLPDPVVLHQIIVSDWKIINTILEATNADQNPGIPIR